IGGLRPGGLQGRYDLRHIALNGAVEDWDDLIRAVVSAASRTHGEAHAEQAHRETPCNRAETHMVSLRVRLRGLQADVPLDTSNNPGMVQGG
ncbi:MAG TPA: hypothetical protein VI542_13160, partial [Candidatus Tectomicrobia bacterium]